jgi:hypothetical protein
MTFSIPIFISALTIFFILPIFGLILQENEKKRMQRKLRTVLDIEALAMNGWILLINRFSRQCAELTKDLKYYKKMCKAEKKVFLPIYDVVNPDEKDKLLQLIGNELLHHQLKGEKPLNIFLPIIYNVESQLYTSLPPMTTPQKLWRCIFELEKNELIHRDAKIDKNKRECLEDDAKETDDEMAEDDIVDVESISSTPDSLPSLVSSSSSEGDEDEDTNKEEVKENLVEGEGVSTSNYLFNEIMKLQVF